MVGSDADDGRVSDPCLPRLAADGFRAYWRFKSRDGVRCPRINSETRALVRRMKWRRECDYDRRPPRAIHFRVSSARSITAANGRMNIQALPSIGAVPKIELPSCV